MGLDPWRRFPALEPVAQGSARTRAIKNQDMITDRATGMSHFQARLRPHHCVVVDFHVLHLINVEDGSAEVRGRNDQPPARGRDAAFLENIDLLD